MKSALVVDDSKAVRTIMSGILAEMGYRVVQAGDGRAALDQLEVETAPPALALVDWNMPNMNGLEFVRSMRGDERYDRTTVMMVTTESEVDQVMAALNAGADEYLMKPFTREMIEDKLRLLGLG